MHPSVHPDIHRSMKSVTMNFEEDEVLALDRYADAEGLSRNGAVIRLLASQLGGVALPATQVGNLRQAFAKALLAQAQKYVGVHPVAIEGEELVTQEDPEATEGGVQFYSNKELHSPGPPILKKVDPMDQSEPDYDYEPPPVEDLDQRAKRGKRG